MALSTEELYRTERLDRVEAILERLTQAQTRTEDAVRELAQAQARTEERVEQLAQAQARTEERAGRLEEAVERLAQAQARTEERMGGLEQAMERLAEAQARAEERLSGLELAVNALARQVGRLSETIGFGLEDIAHVVLPGYLERHLGIHLEGEEGEELARRFLEVDGKEIEINLYGEGEQNGRRIIVLGEARSRIYGGDVDNFDRQVRQVEPALPAEVVKAMFGYFIHPSAMRVAQERGILVVASYQR